MLYLGAKSDGAYPPPQATPFDGAIALNDDQIEIWRAFKGFGDVADGAFTGNQTLLDEWDAAHPVTPEVTPPTLESVATQLEATQSVLDALLMGNITI